VHLNDSAPQWVRSYHGNLNGRTTGVAQVL